MFGQNFSVELSNEITPNSYLNLRRLYLPFIGSSAVILYELLVDWCKNEFCDVYSISKLSSFVKLDWKQINESLFYLEAVGLIDRYVKNDQSHFLIVIKSPLCVQKFNKNALLKNQLIKTIGPQFYEKILYENKKKSISKTDYYDITKKYQDVFVSDFENHINQTNDFYSTMDLEVNSFSSHDENVKKLPSTHFVKYLLSRNVSFDENVMINHLLKQGFSDSSINLFIDFCINQNNRIVRNYIIKIANDFISKGIISFDEVLHELSIVTQSKKNKNLKQIKDSVFDLNEIKKEPSFYKKSEKPNNSINDVLSVDDLKEMF